ncbi:glycosyltransferase [Agrobacterium sp. NPDC090273]|uniref:glycosyltransferase n=1 Tax=Agrobacterium sp. NPDC090273 TaxID=3363919 RepID=UPI00383AAD9D
MRILTISALFPPNIVGGAEMSAWNFARWLVQQGHEVGVLTSANSEADVLHGDMVDGLRTWRLTTPHIYPVKAAQQVGGWRKPVWHLQDHFDPRNEILVNHVLDEFQPDHVNIHMAQGMGHNILKCFEGRDVSVVMFLHDLNLACIKTTMYKNGGNCTGHCKPCAVSAKVKYGYMKNVVKLGLCSPSRANLETVANFFPVRNFKNTDILDANTYPQPTVERVEADYLRILFAGRIHSTKGIDLLLEVLSELAADHQFSITIAGRGTDEEALRARYGNERWCHFAGFIPQTELSNLIENSDVLCVPSIWAENSPGVAIHALSQGLPVLASNRGGIPELVDDGRSGALLPPGDHAAWKAMLKKLLEDRVLLNGWRAYATEHKARFNQDTIGQEILSFIHDLREGRPL